MRWLYIEMKWCTHVTSPMLVSKAIVPLCLPQLGSKNTIRKWVVLIALLTLYHLESILQDLRSYWIILDHLGSWSWKKWEESTPWTFRWVIYHPCHWKWRRWNALRPRVAATFRTSSSQCLKKDRCWKPFCEQESIEDTWGAKLIVEVCLQTSSCII